jgi:hypothetical protein
LDDRTSLALGGLWEFHADQLLEPRGLPVTSDLLLEISQPWRDYHPLPDTPKGPLRKASYVMLVMGLRPKPEGYALRAARGSGGMRLIAAPRYAPSGQVVAEESRFHPFWQKLREYLRATLALTFGPKASDEIWMLIVQRWDSALDDRGSVPRLSVAEGSRDARPETAR